MRVPLAAPIRRLARLVWGSMGAVGFALAPFSGLLVRDAAGDTAMWAFFAGMSIVSALVGALAVRLAWSRRFAPALAG